MNPSRLLIDLLCTLYPSCQSIWTCILIEYIRLPYLKDVQLFDKTTLHIAPLRWTVWYFNPDIIRFEDDNIIILRQRRELQDEYLQRIKRRKITKD